VARQYIPSTPASRGEIEVDEDAHASLLPEGMSHEQAFEAISAIAAELGYELKPVEPAPEKPENEPNRNASTEAWVTYAKERGAKDEDLVDEQGEPLKRDVLAEKYGTPVPPPA
jgi:hypothetical protein